MRGARASGVAMFALLLCACTTGPAVTQPPPTVPGSDHPPSATAAASAEPTPTPAASASVSPEPQPLAWARLDAAGPAAREDHTWTLDGSGDVAYLFGGRDGATVLDDTWTFDLEDETWTQLSPPTAPPARFGHEAVWVEGRGLVIFAGQAGPTFFNDLWAYDPAANEWAQLPADGALPTPRYGSCAAIGPDGRLWISHGFTQDGTRFSDTRAYDFDTGAWSDETPADGDRPVERCLHGCWWTDAGELALYAGQTTGVPALDDRWTLGVDGWTRLSGEVPPPRNLYARARLAGATLVFGGQALDLGYQQDLWLLEDDAADAQALDVSGELPPGRAGAELIVDAAAGRALLFGGRGAGGSLSDMWVLTGL